MILGKKKTIAAIAATAIVASGAMWAPAAQAATNCVPVPGGTLGADVKVGPVEQRVPAITNIKVCAGGATVPLARVATSGGTCTSNCLSVFVGGGALDLDGVSITWSEDGSPHAPVGLDPAPVSGTGETCALSVGFPDAPNPDCFVAIGPDDPTGLVQPVADLAADAIDTAIALVNDGVTITCGLVPDYYDPNWGRYVDFCEDPVGWTVAASNDGVNITCNAMPVFYDDWGYEHRFCSDPVGWTNLLVESTYETCNQALGYQWDPNTWEYVYFCNDPIRWTELTLDNWCGSLCDLPTLQELIRTARDAANENIKIQIGR